MTSVRLVAATTSTRAPAASTASSFSHSAATSRALASRACGGGSKWSSDSASASSRNSTPGFSPIAMRSDSCRISPVFAPNFDVRFSSFRW